ncbi:hypothetical protein K439DRAFT_1643448 [Ramaria rubella]|nr:hypothetical protein K439DRAFT_1643448 [Ramaria rubella]
MRIATAGEGEAKIWNIDSTWSMDLHAKETRSDVTCRTVLFADNGQSLLITYLETSNVVMWNIDPWRKMWDLHLTFDRQITSRAGNAAISPDGHSLLIDNLRNGTDAYSIPSGTHLATFHAPVSERKPKQVTFDPSGQFVIQGSDKGLVYISDFRTLAPVQALVHSKHGALIQAVASHSYQDQFWIASGCSDEPTVMIWKRQFVTIDRKAAVYGFLVVLALTTIYLAFIYSRDLPFW